ncbi:hypothetical protein [uncultured Maribacter sp.]|uniref:hypothetical protein n=1 Tax=uncultured Maribacter sp. TaxID=431308 RepID=UPI00260A1F07|nr:hypothetical protein [uncultured Maribacter sp.]
MMYTIYEHINKQLLGHNRDQQGLMIYNQFRQVLCKDVLFASTMEESNNNTFKLVFREETYTYKMYKNKIIRDTDNGMKDTFNLSFVRMKIEETITEENKRKKALFLTTRVLGEEITLFEEKNDTNANYINNLYLNGY